LIGLLIGSGLPEQSPTVSAASVELKGGFNSCGGPRKAIISGNYSYGAPTPMARPPKAQTKAQTKAQKTLAQSLTHQQIWGALDRLAARAGLSPSGLAKRSGLDPTTFNKSKRVTAEGRERWPSTESVAKALAAANHSIEGFVALIGGGTSCGRSVPLIALAQAAHRLHFDEGGHPAGKGWSEMALPACDDGQCFALEISGDALKPAYRNGDVIVVSLGAPVRRGDRVVVKTREGEMMVEELKRRSAKAIELASLTSGEPDRTLAAADLEWMARIVWVRQ
jgi:phage repressor protein C with HTH and peptisase S24 domain